MVPNRLRKGSDRLDFGSIFFCSSWQKKSPVHSMGGARYGGLAISYSPTCYRSTIGASGLNFSVRNGKRWSPALSSPFCLYMSLSSWHVSDKKGQHSANGRAGAKEADGQLVPLGFAISGFTPAAYRRGRLPRPLKEASSRDGFRT